MEESIKMLNEGKWKYGRSVLKEKRIVLDIEVSVDQKNEKGKNLECIY